MAQAGFTPISLYFSTTAAAVPASGNLVAGELALNTVDEKLYFKNSAGTVKLLASNATSAPVLSFQTSLSGLTPNTSTTGAVTLAGTLGVASGGTGLTAGTSGGILGYTATGTLASSVALTANALVLGAGAGATPTPMASLGTTTTVLHGNASGAPTFGAVSLTADVSGTLPTANGGTNLTSFTSGGVVYASSTSALATGSALVFDGTNLGLGATPSAWYDPANYRAVQIGQSSFVGRLSGAEYTQILSNVFVNASGVYKYINNGTATLYEMLNGSFRWSQAASGTAGNTATFTQAMTLNASGQLGIATTSPDTSLTVDTSSGPSNTVNKHITLGRGTTVRAWLGTNKDGATDNVSALVFGVDTTERARIDSSGNFMVGTTTNSGSGATSGKLVVQFNGAIGNGIYVDDTNTASADNLPMAFGRGITSIGALVTNPNYFGVRAVGALVLGAGIAEQARITSSGYFGIGTSSPTIPLQVIRNSHPVLAAFGSAGTNATSTISAVANSLTIGRSVINVPASTTTSLVGGYGGNMVLISLQAATGVADIQYTIVVTSGWNSATVLFSNTYGANQATFTFSASGGTLQVSHNHSGAVNMTVTPLVVAQPGA